jgi:dsDNA-specific endonuclease/ATPase MutS2
MKKRIVKLSETDLENLIQKILKEEGEERSSRYMFFSNLEQIHRQTAMLMEMDEEMLESILENGHDWAQDHVAEAKNNMDQVFDFIMNKIKEPEDIHNNMMEEKWSKKYKNSIDCNNPKGFSQRAHCQGKNKRG